jgi:hypothetical protein
MPKDDRDLLSILKFELQFLEKGGYGRSAREPWKPTFIFEDSPTCTNYDAKENPTPCDECLLMQLVPPESRGEKLLCRHIPLTPDGETVDYFYRWGSQEELEEALQNWLRATIQQIEAQRKQADAGTQRQD